MNHGAQKLLLFVGGLLIGAMGATLVAQHLMEPANTVNVYVQPGELERLELMDSIVDRLREVD